MDDREVLQRDIQSATDYIVQMEERSYETNSTSLKLLQKLRMVEIRMQEMEAEHKEQVSTLKAFANDIKHRIQSYVPNKQDAIDVKLGQYVNNYPDKRKLKFAFARQAQGKYVFGTRLVTVKVEGSSIHVVTDGTSMPIGQFIDEITPKEI